jgi:hypothetical protein
MVPVLVGDAIKELKLTSKKAAVSIQKIVLNGLIVKAQKLSLEQLGPPPFSVVVPLKSLCQLHLGCHQIFLFQSL